MNSIKNIASHTPKLVISCVFTTNEFITMCHQWLAVRLLVGVPTTGCLVTLTIEINTIMPLVVWPQLDTSTPDPNSATQTDRTHYGQCCCLHWMWCDATWQIPNSKQMPCSISDILQVLVLLLTWRASRFKTSRTSCVQSRQPQNCWCRHGVRCIRWNNNITKII